MELIELTSELRKQVFVYHMGNEMKLLDLKTELRAQVFVCILS